LGAAVDVGSNRPGDAAHAVMAVAGTRKTSGGVADPLAA